MELHHRRIQDFYLFRGSTTWRNSRRKKRMMLELIWQGKTTFRAHVTYQPLDFEELHAQFPAFVDPDYRDARMEDAEMCRRASRIDRTLVFEYVRFRRRMATSGVYANLARRRLRPARLEEAIAFNAAFPDEQKQRRIAALGTIVHTPDGPCVPCLGTEHAWDRATFLGRTLPKVPDIFSKIPFEMALPILPKDLGAALILFKFFDILLNRGKPQRLLLDYLENTWESDWHFLAVRE
jgi:hypothetical protein